MLKIYTLFEDHIPRKTKVTQWIVSGLGLSSASDPSDISGSPTNPDILSESSEEEEEIQMIPLRRSTQNKRPYLHCHLCNQEIRGSVADKTVKNLNPIIKTVMTYHLISAIKEFILVW